MDDRPLAARLALDDASPATFARGSTRRLDALPRALGRERPTVLAIEDIHWASEPLLDLLDHLADALETRSVPIVCPARPELLESRPGWGAGKQNAISLTLSPLLPGAIRDGSSRSCSTRAASSRTPAEQILASAEGNPFFLEEILRMLIEQRRDRAAGRRLDRDGAARASSRSPTPSMGSSRRGSISSTRGRDAFAVAR